MCFIRTSLCLLLGTATLSAIDRDSSGVSDVYEAQMGVILASHLDADGDGYNNKLEELMGTNALDPSDPGMILSLAILQENIGLRSATYTLPNSLHSRYRIHFGLGIDNLYPIEPEQHPDLNWVGDYVVGTGVPTVVRSYDIWPGESGFVRLELLEPAESDYDDLNDAEEALLGTSTTLPDTDGDGIIDSDEFAEGNDPLDPTSNPVLNGQQAWSNAYVIYNEANLGTYSQQAWSNAYVIQNDASTD